MARLRLIFSLLLVTLGTAGCAAGTAIPTLVATAGPMPIAIDPAQVTALPTAPANWPAPSSAAAAPATLPTEAAVAAIILTDPPPAPTIAPIDPPLPTPTPCAEPGRIEFGSIDSAVAGEAMRYRIYLPPCYGQDGHVYPTLTMFGGNVHDDAIWDALGLDEAAEEAITRGDIPPLLIVMPDNGWLANTTTSGPASYEGFILNELLPHVEATYCAWPGRDGRAVGGLSRGGYWSMMMAFRRPDLFRSVGAHSPAFIDSHAGPAEDPAITGATNPLGDLRIWIDIGERDPYLIQAQPLHEALTAAGVPHEWRVNEGTHDETYWREHLDDYLIWYSDGWRVARDELPACDATR